MGFTTLRDVGETIGEYSPIALRNAINSGIVQGPRIYASGPWLTTNCGHNGDTLPPWLDRRDIASEWVADGADECLKAVRERIKMGADFIKIFGSGGIMDSFNHQEFNDEELAAIVGEAHSKGRRVAAHLEFPEGIKACVNAGIDSVEHGWVLTEEVIDLMKQKGAVLVPTIYAIWNLVNHGAEFGMPQAYIDMAKNTIYEKALKSFRMAYEAGVKMAMGTDCGYYPCPHGTNAKELELMMEFCGMSAMEAIVTSTRNGAEALGTGDKLGTLESGKLADVLIVDGDPLRDIKVLQNKDNILMVMKGGTVNVDRMRSDR
jgi:imidazolonepropionase-like amidohydrolase